jgi:uncharacterized oxidoreductase
MQLRGNTILITGGSGGIGLAFAKKFAADNEVIITGRNQAKLDAAAKETPALKTIRSDAGDPAAIRALAQEVTSKYPKLNVLFNNAGIMVFRNVALAESDLGELTSEIDVNLAGPIRLISAFVEHLKSTKGTIINVSSGLAFVPLPAAPVYCATKAAMHSYTISLREQLADHGVEVIELMPPAVKTDLAPLPEEGVKVITTDELVDATWKALGKGRLEIRPGQANGLRFMSRFAPGFIQGQLSKGSKGIIPKTAH